MALEVPIRQPTESMYWKHLFYNLNNEEGDQLLAATTTEIENPKDAVKAADKYTEKIATSLQKLTN